VTAGDTLKWTRSLSDYPATTWTLTYTLVNSTTRITITASASGTDFAVTVSAATSSGYAAGTYDWRAQVSSGGEVYTVGTGRIKINPVWSAATDGRSQARRALEAIESVLEGRASSATAEYEIAGRRLKYIPIPELLQLRDRYKSEVAREERAAGIGLGGRMQVRFLNA